MESNLFIRNLVPCLSLAYRLVWTDALKTAGGIFDKIFRRNVTYAKTGKRNSIVVRTLSKSYHKTQDVQIIHCSAF